MPIFQIQTDAGTFEIDAPDQNSALSALNSLPSPENSWAGSAKALGSGLAEGAIAVAGLPGDVVDLATRGIDHVAGSKTNDAVPFAKTIGSENIKKKVEGYTGEFYKPQTATEKTISTVGSFAPTALLGPGGIARRVATQVVAPGLASEAAGQLAEGTGYEPVARVAGALGGAAGASKIARSLEGTATKAAAVPSLEQIGTAKTAGYQGQAGKALEIDPAYAVKIADRITDNLAQAKFSQKDPGVATVYGYIDGLKKPEFGATHRLADFDNTRRRLNEIAGAGGSAGTAAQSAIRTIDAATARIPKSAVVAGDARAASKELFDARKNAAVQFRSEKIAKILEDARNTAAATHSGGNLENEIYKQVRTMLNNPKKHLRGWNGAEKEALRAVLPGVGSDALRRAGKVLGGGGGLGQLASGASGAAMFGPLGMFALPALGMGANKLGTSLATGRLNKLDETLRSRAPLYGKANYAQRQKAMAPPSAKEIRQLRETLALQTLLAAQQQNAAR